MTNEELKQEAIKKAYGEHYEDLKMVIEHTHGWCKQNLKKYFGEENIQSKVKKDSLVCRPKSLSGIENNRGWVRIEEDGSNLPKIKSVCFVFNKRGEVEEFHFGRQSNFGFLSENEYVLRYFTHYQPIIKPEPPIY